MKSEAKRKAVIDDGMSPELIYGSELDGIMGIPKIRAEKEIEIPKRLVPFSCLNQARDGDAICFYEPDIKFANILINPENYVSKFRGKILITPDCSLYRNAPFVVQLANVYKSRAIGSYYQNKGIKVIPTVRWGGSLTFTTNYLPEKVAFLGVDKKSTVAISGYGCMRGRENKNYFKEGLSAMIKTLDPKVILIYGPMPNSVFEIIPKNIQTIHYQDWISYVKGGKYNG